MERSLDYLFSTPLTLFHTEWPKLWRPKLWSFGCGRVNWQSNSKDKNFLYTISFDPGSNLSAVPTEDSEI